MRILILMEVMVPWEHPAISASTRTDTDDGERRANISHAAPTNAARKPSSSTPLVDGTMSAPLAGEPTGAIVVDGFRGSNRAEAEGVGIRTRTYAALDESVRC